MMAGEEWLEIVLEGFWPWAKPAPKPAGEYARWLERAAELCGWRP